MRRGGRVLVLLGIVLGILTAGGTFLVLSTSQPEVQKIPTRSVIIAQQNIAERTEISLEALGKAEWPEAYIPPGAYSDSSSLAGKLAIQPIYQGQIILPQMVLDKTQVKENRSNASFLVPDGKVAVAFPLSSLTGVAGAIQNGDTVDILLTLTPEVGTQPITPTARLASSGTTPVTLGQGLSVSQLMLQDVLVLNVGGWPVAGADKASGDKATTAAANIITFALTPQDALALKSAREQGQIELALRKAGDHGQFTTEPVNLQYLNKRFNFNLIAPIGR